MFDKLGSNYTRNVYMFSDDFKNVTKIEDPREMGKFFAESVYVVDLESPNWRYFIYWHGLRVKADQ